MNSRICTRIVAVTYSPRWRCRCNWQHPDVAGCDYSMADAATAAALSATRPNLPSAARYPLTVAAEQSVSNERPAIAKQISSSAVEQKSTRS